jgi:hypothetical protein
MCDAQQEALLRPFHPPIAFRSCESDRWRAPRIRLRLELNEPDFVVEAAADKTQPTGLLAKPKGPIEGQPASEAPIRERLNLSRFRQHQLAMALERRSRRLRNGQVVDRSNSNLSFVHIWELFAAGPW